MMNRRSFIGKSLSVAGLAVCRCGPAFAAPRGRYSSGNPELVFGVISDIHVKPLSGGKYFTGPFKSALEMFRKEGVDAVVVAGDMITNAVTDEMEKFAETWFDVFPDDRAPDGRKVERIFVYGNHDVSRIFARRACKGDRNEMKKRAIALDRAKWWKRFFREEFSNVYRKTVKGYDFIGAHWEGETNGRGVAFCKELEAFYEKVGSTLDRSKPFFHVQHPHPKGTCHGDEVWGQDDGTSTRVLSRFPNAVAFSGHSHNSLLDDRAIWQGAFTSVATATASHVGISSLKSGVAVGYENYGSYATNQRDRVKTMPMIGRGYGRQAQLVRVYADRIVFSRYDLFDMKPLAEDWVMPLSAEKGKPYAFDLRRKVAKAPVFPDGAKVDIRRVAAFRRGDPKNAKKTDAVEISVPAANAEPSARGVKYLIEAECGGKTAAFAFLHDAHRFRAGDPRSEAAMKCVIAADRLPKGDVTFKVSAFSWWEKQSAPIVSIYRI